MLKQMLISQYLSNTNFINYTSFMIYKTIYYAVAFYKSKMRMNKHPHPFELQLIVYFKKSSYLYHQTLMKFLVTFKKSYHSHFQLHKDLIQELLSMH